MEKKKKNYYRPVVNVTKVVIEQGIAQVAATSIQGKAVNWEEVDTPVGATPEEEGGDFYIFY
jgi:hypothetical protein